MKPHVAVFVPASHGHINPTLAVSKELVCRGYRVTYAIPEQFLGSLRGTGADYVSYQVSRSQEGFTSDADRGERCADEFWRDIRLSLTTHERFKEDKPDLILFDNTDLSGTLMSRNSPGVLSLKLFASFAHNESFPIGGGQSGNNLVERLMAQRVDKALPEERIGSYFANNVSPLNIVFTPKFFQYRHNTFDDRFFFVGPTIYERPFYEKWAPPPEAEDVVLISLGTVLNARVGYFRACIDALKHLDIYVVMTVGPGIDMATLGEIPANFDVRPFISHLDVLPHTKAFVGHGGMNSTMESLYYGVPMLLAPQDRVQRLIAMRIAELGLGTMLSDEPITPTKLAESLLALLDDGQLVSRVKAIGVDMRRTNGAQVAADIVERAHDEWVGG
jgi:MGT family glycosyltransferase